MRMQPRALRVRQLLQVAEAVSSRVGARGKVMLTERGNGHQETGLMQANPETRFFHQC